MGFADSINFEAFQHLEIALINKQLKSNYITDIIHKHIKNEKIKQDLCWFLNNKTTCNVENLLKI